MPDSGVQFPSVDGRRSTQRTGRDIFAAAASPVDPGLAAQIRAEHAWRTGYPRHLRDLTAAAAMSPDAGLAVARSGLDRVRTTFVQHSGDRVTSVAAAIRRVSGDPPVTRTVGGTRAAPRQLAIPYCGRELVGDDLLALVDDWIARGVVEPPLRAAIIDLIQHPAWLDLRGTWFAVLGAGAEMAPTAQLLRWGADVAAIDVSRPDVWERLERMALDGSGRLHAPRLADGVPPGADLLLDGGRISAWLAGFGQPLVLGNSTYADGEAFARVSVAADAVTSALRADGHIRGVACLATPTDVFAVPRDVVAASRARHGGVPGRVVASVVRAATAGRLLVRNHRSTVRTDAGGEVGVADCLVVQQGPNYALAKRLQRWGALEAHGVGEFAAVHVAPPTRTRSVTRNRVLAAAYDGAPLFGVEIFAPQTSRALMAALLVHALRSHEITGPPASPRDEYTLTAAAAHGGLWRVPWEPRTALPLAVVRGARTLVAGQ